MNTQNSYFSLIRFAYCTEEGNEVRQKDKAAVTIEGRGYDQFKVSYRHYVTL